MIDFLLTYIYAVITLPPNSLKVVKMPKLILCRDSATAKKDFGEQVEIIDANELAKKYFNFEKDDFTQEDKSAAVKCWYGGDSFNINRGDDTFEHVRPRDFNKDANREHTVAVINMKIEADDHVLKRRFSYVDTACLLGQKLFF